MHAIELKDPAGFGNEFLRLTLLQGFQSLTKRDLELLIFVLLLSALTASLFGTLLGALLRDMNTLLAALKAGGLLLMAPAILEMVPKAPDWIARIFPTYYILNPVMEVAERGAGLDAILGNLLVLAAIAGLLVFGLALVIERQQKRLALF